LGFPSDINFAGTDTRTQEKYRPFIAALRKAGWSVAPLTHLVTVGARATVPIRNAYVLEELRILKVADQKSMQHGVACTAAIHLNMIVWQYRKLCKTIRNNIDN
jgi:hypothetical protein